MSIEQLLAKYKVQLPNNKDQSDEAEESSKFIINLFNFLNIDDHFFFVNSVIDCHIFLNMLKIKFFFGK